MKTLTTLSTALLIATSLMSTANAAPMTNYMEQALVETCKAAASNKTMQFKNTLKAHRLNEKTVALAVVCNGEDIITFALNHGANKTAEKLQNSIGEASITDLTNVQVEKLVVSFASAPK